MDFVVTVLSWAGWIWTAAVLAVVLPLLAFKARRAGENEPAGEESHAPPDA